MNERSEGQGVAARVGAKRPPPERRAGDPSTSEGDAAADASGAREPISATGLAARVHADYDTLETELTEIALLTQQARLEAARHETKRAAAADRLTALGPNSNPNDVAEQSRQLVTLTRRAVVMQAQVDVLEGKLKVLQRFRDAALQIATDIDQVIAADELGTSGAVALAAPAGARGRGKGRVASTGSAADIESMDVLPPAVSRIVLGAQEDLRREIARTMHDGPAQSLTNIVLQAQIVERLVSRDPASAQPELRQLIAMVQQTLDATKSFIFDVRPMVLDDLGLVPTVRRAARERGRRAQIPVEFESYGTDRRLSMELESGLFRILDETLAAYLAGRPDRVTIRLDWADGLEARIVAHRPAATPFEADTPAPAATAGEAARAEGGRGRGRGKVTTPASPEAMPAALAAMIDERRQADTAAKRAVGAIPAATVREIRQRAATLGLTLEMSEDGREVRVALEQPVADDTAPAEE